MNVNFISFIRNACNISGEEDKMINRIKNNSRKEKEKKIVSLLVFEFNYP